MANRSKQPRPNDIVQYDDVNTPHYMIAEAFQYDIAQFTDIPGFESQLNGTFPPKFKYKTSPLVIKHEFINQGSNSVSMLTAHMHEHDGSVRQLGHVYFDRLGNCGLQADALKLKLPLDSRVILDMLLLSTAPPDGEHAG